MVAPAVHAAPPKPVPAKPAPTKPAAKPKTIAERLTGDARKHFEVGVELYGVKNYAGAMAEFQQAYEVGKEPRVLRNVAVCLKNLARYAEAIAALRKELKDATDLTDDEKTKLDEEVGILLPLTAVATVDVTETGAEVSVDGRVLGLSPLSVEVRVDVGERTFVAKREGFRDASVKLVVAGATQPTVTLKLEKIVTVAPVTTGTLKVVEAKGLVVDVLVDGALVGKTPWEGPLPQGHHTVALRGPDETGAAPEGVQILVGEVKKVQLESKALDAELEVTVEPDTARVLADGAELSRGSFKGTLMRGKHVIEVVADGHRSERRELVLTTKRVTLASFSLVRIRNVYIELSPAFGSMISPGLKVVSPTGAAEPDLPDRGLTFGALVRGGYRFSFGLGLEAMFGQTFTGAQEQPAHAETLTGTSATGAPVSVSEKMFGSKHQFQHTYVGAGANFRFFDTITIGFATGLVVMQPITTVVIQSQGVGADFPDQSNTIVKPFFAPEIRLGARLGAGFALHFGVTLMMVPMSGFDAPSLLQPKGGAYAGTTFALPYVSGSGLQLTPLGAVVLEFNP